MSVSNFDVLKRMASENRDIRLGVDVLSATLNSLGTKVEVGIAGDLIASIASGRVAVCLLVYDRLQFAETKSELETQEPPIV